MTNKPFLRAIDARLAESADEFAQQFGSPALIPWIKHQYDLGYKSPADYEKIVAWVDRDKPRISNFDFNSALRRANVAGKPAEAEFSTDEKLKSNDVEIELKNGSEWLKVHPEDCNTVCHKMSYDFSSLLEPVIGGRSEAWVLADPQGNLIVLFVRTHDGQSIAVGPYNHRPSGTHQDIRQLCVKKGFELLPEAFSDDELVTALMNREVDIETIKDVRSLISRLSPSDIITCNLLRYCHYLPLAKVFEIWQKTKKDCLLKYVFCSLVAYNLTSSKFYAHVRDAVESSKIHAEMAQLAASTDTRPYTKSMDEAVEEISSL